MKIRLSLLCIAVALGAFNVADAQGIQGGPVAQAGFRQTKADLLHQPGFPGRVWFESNYADKGLGFDGSYLSLGGKTRLFEDRLEGRWLAEGQVNYSVDSDVDEFFGNVGIERVFSVPAAGAQVSIGAWYDYNGKQDANFSHEFHQVGVNASIKTAKWDLLGNGYFPTGSQNHTFGDVTGADCFVGHDIVLLPGIDSALRGFDVAMRFRPKQFAFCNGTFDLGGYQYSSDLVDSFGGGKVRFGCQILRGMIVNAEVNHDERFETTGILGVGWLFGANASGHGHEYSSLGRDLEQTVRNDHIVRYNQEFVLALDPDTGLAYDVIHVDNSADAGGDGTVESRFATLAEAEAASGTDDIIFVYEGDGTSTGYDEGIVLQDRQMLLGDGVEHSIPLPGGDSFLLCNDVDGMRPTLVHDGGDIVTLADDNVVAGLILDGFDPANSGIVGTGVSGSTIIRDNEIINLLVDGVRLDGPTGDLSVARNTFNNIQGDAIQINDVTSTGSLLAFENNTIDDIAGNGIKIEDFDAENDWLFSGNMITNVGPIVPTAGLGYGIALVDGRDAIGGVGGTFVFEMNTIDATTADGIHIEDVVDPEAMFTFSGNTVSNPGENGLAFVDSLGGLAFVDGSFTGAANGAGFLYDVSGGGTEALMLTGLTSTGNAIGAAINASAGTELTVIANDNVFDMNTSHGIQLNATDAGTSIDLISFAGNTVSNNGGRGLEFNGDRDTVIEGVVVENRFENNALGGLVAESYFGEMNMVIGRVPRPVGGAGIKPAFPENQFVDNGEVGLGLIYRGEAFGHFNIDENVVTGTNNTAVVTPFEGDGIHVRFGNNDTVFNSSGGLPANVLLGPSTINRNLVGSLTDPTLGNDGDGIEVFIEDESIIEELDIQGNVSGNNGLNGLNVVANDSSEINNLDVSENIFNNNVGNGARFASTENAQFVSNDPFGVHNNTMNNNTGSGVALFVAADALLDLDIFENEMDGNGADGINTSENVNAATDLRGITGNWRDNAITNNAGNGITSGAATRGLIVMENMINTNGLYGVSIPGAGSASYIGNEIIGNGTNAGARGSSGGVNIFSAGTKTLTFTTNNIFENIGDGMRIVQNANVVAPGDGLLYTIVVDTNTIEANSDRGVSVINQGDNSMMELSLINNKIASNLDEGVFIINTSSTTQSIDQNIDPSVDTDLVADGLVDTSTSMMLLIDRNRIINNGAGNDNEANGLVLLVGTNDGDYDFFEDGLFFGEGRGGVGAFISNNVFAGNAGDDVFIRSFTSTVDPSTTQGTWEDQNDDPRDPTNDEFDIDPADSFEGDPLARLDLVWLNNTFQSTDVTNVGATYNNDEEVFKSRTVDQDGDDPAFAVVQDDDGIFEEGTRDRNAQRLAARDVEFFDGFTGGQLNPDLSIGSSDSFLFPGMGQSTFRLLAGSDSRADLELQGFILDAPYVDINDADGVVPNGSPGRPEYMPFGWNYFDDNLLTARPQ